MLHRDFTRLPAALALITAAATACGTPTSQVLEGLAFVNKVEVMVTQAGPLLVEVKATGELSDPCTTLKSIDQERQAQEFVVMMRTERDQDALCVQVTVPFEERFLLEQAGLSPGDYEVRVNGVRAPFTVKR